MGINAVIAASYGPVLWCAGNQSRAAKLRMQGQIQDAKAPRVVNSVLPEWQIGGVVVGDANQVSPTYPAVPTVPKIALGKRFQPGLVYYLDSRYSRIVG